MVLRFSAAAIFCNFDLTQIFSVAQGILKFSGFQKKRGRKPFCWYMERVLCRFPRPLTHRDQIVDQTRPTLLSVLATINSPAKVAGLRLARPFYPLNQVAQSTARCARKITLVSIENDQYAF
jgi:hypothetical protein